MGDQQIIVSGVGGQGVLFITRLLAEAAIEKGMSVLASETHGMAQRGGTVLSHLKVGAFSSPLIRPHQADGLLALKKENISQHGFFVKPGAWIVVNSAEPLPAETASRSVRLDADRLAREIRTPKSVNLILLGFALRQKGEALFCDLKDIEMLLSERMAEAPDLLAVSLKALKAGYGAASV